MTPRYTGKVAAITGGGSGIGAQCCKRLAQEGARIAVIDLSAESAEAVATSLRSDGAKALALVADVSDPAAVADIFLRLQKEWGKLDLAVNCAGIAADTDLIDDDIALWQRLIDVNLSGTYYSMIAERRIMRAAGGGAIVNIASVLGQVGYPGAGGYAASKHGVIGLTRSSALTWASEGIRVNAVCPGFVRTPMMAAATDEQWARIEGLHPLGRLPTADNVAASVAYLGSAEADCVTGAVHMVDSGYTAG